MKDATPQLGTVLDPTENRRDAVHVAIAPATSSVYLAPGQHVRMTNDGAIPAEPGKGHGVVDPFLCEVVKPGDRFWLCLYPNTITGLRHVWSHPDFAAMAAARREKP